MGKARKRSTGPCRPTPRFSNARMEVTYRLPTIGGITLSTLIPIDDTDTNR